VRELWVLLWEDFSSEAGDLEAVDQPSDKDKVGEGEKGMMGVGGMVRGVGATEIIGMAGIAGEA
jgi:hypothetical protein